MRESQYRTRLWIICRTEFYYVVDWSGDDHPKLNHCSEMAPGVEIGKVGRECQLNDRVRAYDLWKGRDIEQVCIRAKWVCVAVAFQNSVKLQWGKSVSHPLTRQHSSEDRSRGAKLAREGSTLQAACRWTGVDVCTSVRSRSVIDLNWENKHSLLSSESSHYLLSTRK